MVPSTIAINDQWYATAYGIYLRMILTAYIGRIRVGEPEGRPIILYRGKESGDWTNRWNSSGPRIRDKLDSNSESPFHRRLKMTHAHGHWHVRIQRGANAHEVGIAFLIERGSRSGESSVLIRLRVDHPNPSPSPSLRVGINVITGIRQTLWRCEKEANGPWRRAISCATCLVSALCYPASLVLEKCCFIR